MGELIKDFSPSCVRLTEHFEGVVLHKYDDGVGKITIGIGHAIKPGETFPEKITPEFARELLMKDLQVAKNAILKNVKVPLNQCQFDALGVFIFNVGASAFASSTLLKKLNAGDYEGASKEFIRWNKGRVKGVLVEMPGLTRRRFAEQKLFNSNPAFGDPLKFIIQ